MIQSFRDLTVWQKGMDLAVDVYLLTEKLPRSEMFGLTSQLRRASVSIPSNVAEGKGVGARGYIRHVRIALGSEAELQTQVELTMRLGMIDKAEAEKVLLKVSEVGRMLASLLKSLKRNEPGNLMA